jgi:hypothetical protein
VTGSFGIVGQDDGATLLARGGGPIELFVPYALNVSPLELIDHGAAGQNFSSFENGTLVVQNQTNGGWSWWGPYVSLAPGNYTVTFLLSVSNTSRANHIDLDVAAHLGSLTLASALINGSWFSAPDVPTSISIPFHGTFFSNTIEFRGLGTVWGGILTVYGISATETGPP